MQINKSKKKVCRKMNSRETCRSKRSQEASEQVNTMEECKSADKGKKETSVQMNYASN